MSHGSGDIVIAFFHCNKCLITFQMIVQSRLYNYGTIKSVDEFSFYCGSGSDGGSHLQFLKQCENDAGKKGQRG